MPPDLTLRPATHADCAAVQSLVFGVLAEYGLQADPATTDADLFDLEGYYSRRGGCFDVVTDAAGTVIASAGLYPAGAGICELRKMYVQAGQRGRGLGRDLLQHVLKRACALGFTEIHLETAAVLKEAVAMYKKAGFQRFEMAHTTARCDAAYRLVLPPTQGLYAERL